MQKAEQEQQDVISINLAARPLSDVIKEVEAVYFSHVLTEAGGNKIHAAKRAGMTIATFRRKISAYTNPSGF
jgi:DNA-binding NtrC family response regulator